MVWEDEAPAESRMRRVRQGVPVSGAVRRGLPAEPADADGEAPPRLIGSSQDWLGGDVPPRPWWRPTSTAGRVFVTLCVLMVLGGLVTGAFELRKYLARDGRFRIAGTGNIQATGLTEVSRAEMLPVFGEDIGRNFFFVPLGERRSQLEQIPWVERATVMRVLPDQIRVSVAERQPVAFVREGQQIGLVDASGVLLTMPAAMMAQHHYSFPVVTGIDARDPAAARKARMAVYGRLLAELDASGQRLSEQISEIDLTDPDDARVLMPETGNDILAHFGNDRFLERYQRYKTHIAEWRQQYPKLSAVDLRYEQQVVLEMAPGAQAAQTVTEAAASKASQSAGPDADKDAGPAAALSEGPAKPSPEKPVQAAQPAKAGQMTRADQAAAKTPGKASTKAKQAAQKKKRKGAEPRRAALNGNKQQTARRTASGQGAVLGSGQGQ
jgi:cell division protein FtsQ